MAVVMRIAASVALLLAVALLAVSGFAQFQDGWARDQSLPIPNYLLMNIQAPAESFRFAADSLAHANPANGAYAITRAEAAIDGGAPLQSQIGLIELGLSASPASARGWMLLAYTSTKTDPSMAQRAASIGYLIGPTDYWVANIRAQQAIGLWDLLDTDTRSLALAQVRLLWQEPALNWALLPLLSTPEGAKLVTRAFAGHTIDLISLNRWVLRAARFAAPQAPH